MATLLDRFVVEFGLDPKDHKKGSDEVRKNTRRTKNDIESDDKEIVTSNRKATESFKSLKSEVAGLVLAFAGAKTIKGFIGDILGGDAAVYRLAHNIGSTTQGLSAWGMALGSAGGDAEDAAQAFKMLADARDQLNIENTTGHDMQFNRAGITQAELNKGPEATLLALAERRGNGMKNDNIYASNLRSMGMSEPMITTLKKGRVAVEQLIEAQKKAGALTDEQGRKAVEFDAALHDLSNRIKADARPAIDELAAGFSTLEKNVDLAKAAVPLLTGVIASMVAGLVLANPELTVLAAIFAGIAASMEKINKANANDGSFWGGAKGMLMKAAVSKADFDATQAADAAAQFDRTHNPRRQTATEKAESARLHAEAKAAKNRADALHKELTDSQHAADPKTAQAAYDTAVQYDRDHNPSHRSAEEAAESKRLWALSDKLDAAAHAPKPAGGGKTSQAEKDKWKERIRQEGIKDGLSGDALAHFMALAEHESGFDPNRPGPLIMKGAHKGDRAVGLFQYMAKSAVGWDRNDPEAQVVNATRIYADNVRKYGVQGALAIQQSGNPKAGRPGGPDPMDGNQHTNQFLADINRMSGKYGGAGAGAPVTNVTSVGTINVYTASTDAKGIAEELPGAITQRGLTTQANRGMD